MKKVFFLIILFLAGYCKSQDIVLSTKDSLYSYRIKDEQDLSFIRINLAIKNVSGSTVGFVLDTKSLGVYESPNSYIFDENTIPESGIYENVFSPRIILFDTQTANPLKLDFYGKDIQYTEEGLAKIINKKKEIEKKEIAELKKYKRIFFPKKNLKFIEKAMYINTHFTTLKPHEIKNITLLFNPQNYKHEGKFNGIGFLLEKDKKYDFVIKIHTERETTMKYLDSKNIKLIKKENIKIISEDVFSQKLQLVAQ